MDNSAFAIPDGDLPLSEEGFVESVESLPSAAASAKWSQKLVFDLALGLDAHEDICHRYNLSLDELERLFGFPLFRQQVANCSKELRENNTTFRTKAKIQAEDYLELLDGLMYDTEVTPSTKLSIFQTLSKLGDLEPEPKRSEATPASSINISIAMENAEQRLREISITPEIAYGDA